MPSNRVTVTQEMLDEYLKNTGHAMQDSVSGRTIEPGDTVDIINENPAVERQTVYQRIVLVDDVKPAEEAV